MNIKRYLVTGDLTIYVYTEVLASSPAEAKKIAAQRCVVSLCNQCGSDETIEEEWVTNGTLDGEPKNLRCGA